ncbi:MAG: YqgE/AlgH family protein [Dehalococcoidia bacterium]|nr:YqgE/AlgH family protein [Dehalococcoidia bacterium]
MADSLAGKLLLASLRITEPTFFRTVVFVCAHDAEGALGVVINRPLKGRQWPGICPGSSRSRANRRYSSPAGRSKRLQPSCLAVGNQSSTYRRRT